MKNKVLKEMYEILMKRIACLEGKNETLREMV